MVLVLGIVLGSVTGLEGMRVMAESVDEVESQQYYSVDFRIDNEWEQGYNATITITNISEKTIDNWYLAFQTDDEIQNLQCGMIIQHEGNQYLVKNAGWNKDIPVGGSVNFTYTALKSSEYADQPENYSIDVVLLDVDAGRFTSEFIVQSDWGDGFTGVLVIKNVSEESILDWKLDFEFAGEIENLTGGDWTNLGNGMYEVAEYSYDQGIAPGGVINIQIVGKRSSSDIVPTEINMRTAEYWIATDEPEELPSGELDMSNQLEEIENIKALNGGELPEMYVDEEDGIPFFIGGKYSDVKVIDYDSAIQSLHAITNIMYIYWDEVSFEGVSIEKNSDLIFYRLQQMYCNMEVVGKQLIVVTDSDGNIVTLSGDFDPLYQLDTTQNVDEETARQTAESILQAEVNEGKIVWYSMEMGYDEPAWYFESNSKCIYISAVYGDELISYSLYSTADDENIVREHVVYGNNGDFYVEHNLTEEEYYLRDSIRKIEVVNSDGKVYDNPEVLAIGNADSSHDNVWSVAGGKSMSYATKVYDYYLNLVGMNGFNDQAPWFKVIYNSYTDDGEDNAFARYFEHLNMGIIVIHDGRTPSIRLDLIAHEYAHLVEMARAKLIYSGESGAIKEAFADCMSELLDCSLGDEAWANQDRDIAGRVKLNATHDEMPIKLSDDSYRAASDSRALHGNSCLISYAVYQLYRDGYADADTMAKMVYHAMTYLPADAKYVNVRTAMAASASYMGLDKTAIDRVFDDAEIFLIPYTPGNGKVTYNIRVLDIVTKKPIENAKIEVSQTFNNSMTWTDANGEASVQLYNIEATIIVSALGYEANKAYYTFNGSVNEVIQLAPLKTAQIEDGTGMVRDGQSNIAITGARIRLRQGVNATCGRYLTGSDKQVIETYTASDGSFTIPQLPCGVYTVEIAKDGYIVGYEDFLVRPASSEQEMQIYYIIKKMKMNECRAVLTWNANPRDLDSHLECYEDNKFRYHIFYRYKKYGNEAMLDIDDVNGYGPETVTIHVNRHYTYKYYVHWYSGAGTWKTSGARVRIYSGNKEIADLYVDPEQIGNWEVFTIENGKVYFNGEKK